METTEDAKYVSLYSESGDGFITKDVLKEYALPSGDVYVCGPVGFMEAMINHLLELGFTNEQIHYEFFGPALQLELVNA